MGTHRAGRGVTGWEGDYRAQGGRGIIGPGWTQRAGRGGGGS